MNPATLTQALSHFTGSETFTRWSPLYKNDVLTEGANYLAEQAKCHWLFDIVGSVQYLPELKGEPFQVWSLTKSENSSKHDCVVMCDEGNGFIIYTQHIPFTDFPLEHFSFYAVRNELGGVTIMLKSEY